MNDRAEPKAHLKHAQNATGHLLKRKIPILSICQYVTLKVKYKAQKSALVC